MHTRMRTFARQSGFTILETLFVLGIIGVIGAIAVPQLTNSMAYFRISGDARSVSNAIAVTKMRAASNFSRSLHYCHLSANSRHVEKPNTSTPPHFWADGCMTYAGTGT